LPAGRQSLNRDRVRIGEKEGGPAEARVAPDAIDAASEDDALYARALRAELERRLAEVGRYDDDVFGRPGLLDVILVAVLFVVLPIGAVIVAWHVAAWHVAAWRGP
jgi:hypothetical protein